MLHGSVMIIVDRADVWRVTGTDSVSQCRTFSAGFARVARVPLRFRSMQVGCSASSRCELSRATGVWESSYTPPPPR